MQIMVYCIQKAYHEQQISLSLKMFCYLEALFLFFFMFFDFTKLSVFSFRKQLKTITSVLLEEFLLVIILH